MRTCLALTILISLGGIALRPARAEVAPPERVTSYRAWTLTADALSVTLITLASLGDRSDGDGGRDLVLGAGMGTGLFAAPIIHGARGHGARAFRSLGVRVGLGMAGALIAAKAIDCTGTWCQFDAIGPGFAGGVVVAAVVDAAFFTDERETPSGWAPQVVVTGDRFQLGVAARF